jgi:hypothetical protein
MGVKLVASSGGSVELVPTNTASNFTVTVPAATGTMLTTASTAVITQAMLSTNVAGNGPTFRAQKTSEQSPLSISAWNKVTWPVESWDVGPCFDTANSRFQPSVAGYYQINTILELSYGSGGPSYWNAAFYKNGAEYGANAIEISDVGSITLSDMVYMNGSTDYVEVFVRPNGGTTVGVYPGTCFSASLVRSAT